MTGPGALAALTSTSTFAVLETDDPPRRLHRQDRAAFRRPAGARL